MRVAVIGIGNELLMDEGAGPACARYLQARYELPDCVDVLDRSVMGMAVVSDLREHDVALVLDAVEVPGATPGQLFSFAPQDALGGQAMGSLHEMRFADVLATAELMGVRCTGHCMGVQAENISPEEFAMALTPRVAAAVPLLAAFAARWLAGELGLAVTDRFAAQDLLRAGCGAPASRTFAPRARLAPYPPSEEALPALAGAPDVSVMAYYLRAGLAAVGAADVEADEPAGEVSFSLPACEASCQLARRFGVTPAAGEGRGQGQGADAGQGQGADAGEGAGDALRLRAHVCPDVTDYDCDALIGGVKELLEAREGGR